MDKQQHAAAYRLLAAAEQDPKLKEECCDYGNLYQYSYDHLRNKEEKN
jgi:hypothetical protein